MKHKNLQSLEHYIGGPTHSEKENYSESLFNYTHDQNKCKAEKKQDEQQEENAKKLKLVTPDPPPGNVLVPLPSNFENETNTENIPMSQKVIENSLRQAANMFQNATFTNCSITFQMPK